MMHGSGKSDPAIVAMKPANKAAQAAAESVERRAGTEGNADQQSTLRAQNRAGVTQALDRVREAARQRKKERFTALLHHIGVDTLRQAFYALQRKAAPGVDGLTWGAYETALEPRLEDLHARVHRGAYRPQPSRRTYIPKADGRQRPLAIAALEDKIVQGAAVMVLNAIYEEDFLGFSYGFRPGRGAHDALDALSVGITRRKVNWILDADIRSFFDTVNQQWLIRFVEHRICSSSAALRRRAARSAVRASRRPSTSWASPSSAARAGGANSSCYGSPDATACGRSCGKSRRRCVSVCISRFPSRGFG